MNEPLKITKRSHDLIPNTENRVRKKTEIRKSKLRNSAFGFLSVFEIRLEGIQPKTVIRTHTDTPASGFGLRISFGFEIRNSDLGGRKRSRMCIMSVRHTPPWRAPSAGVGSTVFATACLSRGTSSLSARSNMSFGRARRAS